LFFLFNLADMPRELHSESASNFSNDEETVNENSTTPSMTTPVREEEQERGMGPSIEELARQFSNQFARHPQTSTAGCNPFLSSNIPSLDPNSKEFDPKQWIRALLDITSRDAERYPSRTSGVSHRNLTAYGFGSNVNYQADVLSIFSRGAEMAMTLLGRRKRKSQILQDFDGLVKSGEMLLVLGRPGRYVLENISHQD
jgi:hypothetical protein